MAEKFPLDIVLSTVDRTTAGFDGVSKKIDAVSKKVGRVGKSMTKNLTLPIVGIGAAGVKAFSEFEAGMSNVSTLVDTSTESMDDMGKQVLSVSRDVPVALNDLTSALFDVRSAGIDSAEAMGVLENSAKLGVAGLGSTAEAADLVTSSINAFGLEGEKANQVYDQIFKTTKNGKTTIAELSQGFGSVAGIVANSGTELDEYLASVAALTTTGAPASKAHTQLKAVISGLTRETKQSSKIFRELGAKDFKDLIAKSGGLVPALDKINKQVKGNEADLLKLVGSTEAMGAVLGLTGGQSEAFTETLANMRDGSEEANEAFEKQNKTSAAQWQRTKNALTSAAISIGTVLAPVLTKVAEKVAALANWFRELDEDTKETIIKFAGFAAAAGPVFMMISKITSGVKALSLALGAGPLGILVGGLLAIKAITGDDFATIFDDAITFWKENLGEVFEWIEGKIKAITQVIDEAVSHFTGEQSKLEKETERLQGNITRDEFAIRKGTTQGIADIDKAIAESDAKFEALLAKQALEVNPGFDATAPVSTAQGHVMVEFQNAPEGMRVKSIKGADAVDVKSGFQGR